MSSISHPTHPRPGEQIPVPHGPWGWDDVHDGESCVGSQMPAVARERGQHVCQDIPVDVNLDGNVEESGAFREQSNMRWK